MLWNIALGAVMGIGGYFGPAYVGEWINQYSSDPMVRMEQQLIDSENLREMHDECRRIHLQDQPSHLTPYRVHGGVGPVSSSI